MARSPQRRGRQRQRTREAVNLALLEVGRRIRAVALLLERASSELEAVRRGPRLVRPRLGLGGVLACCVQLALCSER